MTEDHKRAFNALFKEIYQDNPAAISLSFALLAFLHAWDDIHDEDYHKLKDVDSVFLDMLTSVSANPIWDTALQGCFLSVYYRWHAANCYESDKTSTDNRLAKAWVLRAGCYDLFVLIARKLYGHAWAKEIAPLVYDFYGESLEAFLAEVKHA